ncbi:MAG TPA: hypothetical protein VHD90_06200 [Phototrophicaceae bacterium]|nr:hypothetical protein [Phototrophicaceae bacterium]
MLNPLDYLIVQMQLQAPPELAEQLQLGQNLSILGTTLNRIIEKLIQGLRHPSVSLDRIEDCEDWA